MAQPCHKTDGAATPARWRAEHAEQGEAGGVCNAGGGVAGSATTAPGKSATSFEVALLAGGIAGMSVDMALFPLDTLKTRMQAPRGFRSSGGFRGLYNGVFAAAAGSAPGAAVFFSTYETVKPRLTRGVDPAYHPVCYMVSSACGEVAACWIRVPTENIKQKMQAGLFRNTGQCLRNIAQKGVIGGFYKGYCATVSREIPFSFIQFPIYETLKTRWAAWQKSDLTPMQVDVRGPLCVGLCMRAYLCARVPWCVCECVCVCVCFVRMHAYMPV